MANTRFQHKRSSVSGVVPTTSDIATGELGINLADRRLFTSNGTAVFELGANLTSLAVGNSTVRQTANSSGLFVNGDVVITGTVNAANITASLFTGALTGTASNATNLNSQPGSFYTNASNITTGTLPNAQLGANVTNTSANFTITGVRTHQANIVVGNTTVNTQHSNATILISNSTSTTTLGLADLRVGNTATNVVIANTTSSFGGNVVITGSANVAANLTIGASGELIISNGAGIQANGTFGTSGHALLSNGTGVYWAAVLTPAVTSSQFEWSNLHTFQANLHTGNSTVNTRHSNATILISNSTSTTTLGLTDLRIGNTATNVVIANTTSTFGGNVVITGTANVSANLVVGASGELIISNGAGIQANGTFGTAGQVLSSNGTGVYWVTASGGASITANNTDTQTFYIPMANITSGSWSNGVVSTTKLYFVPSTGTLNATVFNSLSDKKLKVNVKTVDAAVNTVTKLRGVRFDWKDNKRPSAGVIAQELEKILPELVSENEIGHKSVNYNGIIAYLIEAVKELSNEIEKLRR